MLLGSERRQGEKQGEKDKVIKFIEDVGVKINKRTNKLKIPQLKQMRKEALNRLQNFGGGGGDLCRYR